MKDINQLVFDTFVQVKKEIKHWEDGAKEGWKQLTILGTYDKIK